MTETSFEKGGIDVVPGEVTAFISALCYSLTFILLRKGQADTQPVDNGLFPVLLVSSVILSTSLAVQFYTASASYLPSQHWVEPILFCVGGGMLSTLFGRRALYAAIHQVGATRGIVVKTLASVVTLTIGVTVLHEQFDTKDILGVLFLLVGVAFLLTERRWLQTRIFPSSLYRLGLTLALVAALLQGVGHALRKVGMMYSISPLLAATVDVVSAFLVYLVILALFGRMRVYWRIYRNNFSLYFITAGFFAAASVLLFFTAISTVPISTVSVIIGSEPVLVALLSAVFLSKLERLTWVTLFSSTMVAVGVMMMSLTS